METRSSVSRVFQLWELTNGSPTTWAIQTLYTRTSGSQKLVLQDSSRNWNDPFSKFHKALQNAIIRPSSDKATKHKLYKAYNFAVTYSLRDARACV